MIRTAAQPDAFEIANIYNHYILNTFITFEMETVTAEEIGARIAKYSEVGPYLVYEEDQHLIGYAYVSRFRERKAYVDTVESTIYLKHDWGGKGIGFQLYSKLLSRVSENHHVIVAGIALPNEASVRLHEKCGFRKVGHFSEVGRKFDQWIDVGFWQRAGNV